MLFVKNKGKDVDLKEILGDRIDFMKASARRRSNFMHSQETIYDGENATVANPDHYKLRDRSMKSF